MLEKDTFMNSSYLSEDKPPVCLHVLGQGLVNDIWKEGKAYKEENECLWKDINKLRKLLDQIKAIDI